MYEISMNLFLGIVSGVVTLGLVWITDAIWKGKIVPWYEERQYKGSEISGKWKAEINYADGDKNTVIYDLKRNSVNVTGEATCTVGDSIDMKWGLNGYFENLILTLSYKSLDRKKIDKGSVTVC